MMYLIVHIIILDGSSFFLHSSNMRPEGKSGMSSEVYSVLACARTCFRHDSCAAFTFNDKSYECDLFNYYTNSTIMAVGYNTYHLAN